MSRFCAKCGLEYKGDIPFINNLCIKCYLEENPIIEIPSIIKLKYCKICGAVYTKGSWDKRFADVSEGLKHALVQELHVKSKPPFTSIEVVPEAIPTVDGEFRVKLHIKALVLGHSISQEGTVKVRINSTICPSCSKKAQGAFEAIVQIRSATGSLTKSDLKVINRALEKLPERIMLDIVSIDEVPEGIDIKVLSYTTARHIASLFKNDLGARVVESYKLVGIDRRGKRRSKLTISVRLPFFKVDDVVMVRNVPAIIKRIVKGKVVYERLDSRAHEVMSIEDAWSGGINPIPETAFITRLLYAYRDDKFAYLMDTSNIEVTYRIPLHQVPEGLKLGEEVKVLVVDGKPYVIV